MFPGPARAAPKFLDDVQTAANVTDSGAPANPVDTVLTPTPRPDSLGHPNGDFYGSGNSDILWQNDSGDVALWQLASGSGAFSGFNDYGVVASNWQFQQIADVTGDGKADVIWRDSTDNEIGLWTSGPGNGAAFTYQNLGYVPSDWHLVGSGNFNAEAGPDSLVWRDDNGEVGLWNFTGGSGPASFTTQLLGAVPTSMVVQGVIHGGDEIVDILLRDTSTGDLVLWYQEGAGPAPYVFGSKDLGVISTDWQIQGVGDFNNDGGGDILWRNTTNGDVALWILNIVSGFYNYTQQDLGIVPLDWHVQQVDDFNGVGAFDGEGRADILWRNSTDGDVLAWYSEGGLGGTPVSFTFSDFGHQSLTWHVETNWLGT